MLVVVVLGFYVPPTAKVIQRRDLGLKSHPKDWRSSGSNSGPLVYKACSLTARPRRLLKCWFSHDAAHLVQNGIVVSEKIRFEFLYVHDLGPWSRNDHDFQYSHTFIKFN